MVNIDDEAKKSLWDMTLPELIADGKGFWIIFPILAIFQIPLALIALAAADSHLARLGILAILIICAALPAKLISFLFDRN